MKTTIAIRGMHCDECTRRISAALRRVPGVSSARVSLDPPAAEIETTGPVARQDLERAVRSAGDYTINDGAGAAPAPARAVESADAAKPSLYPLVLILLFIAGVTALTTFVRAGGGLHTFMNDFMAGFFLVFSFFKLLDLRGFAGTYRTYDILARAWHPWGYLYPFIELALGVAYLVGWQPALTNTVTLALMLIGAAGVLRALVRKDAIRCACLGTALNLPMTTVTLTEDLVMAAMAAAMLLWHA